MSRLSAMYTIVRSFRSSSLKLWSTLILFTTLFTHEIWVRALGPPSHPLVVWLFCLLLGFSGCVSYEIALALTAPPSGGGCWRDILEPHDTLLRGNMGAWPAWGFLEPQRHLRKGNWTVIEHGRGHVSFVPYRFGKPLPELLRQLPPDTLVGGIASKSQWSYTSILPLSVSQKRRRDDDDDDEEERKKRKILTWLKGLWSRQTPYANAAFSLIWMELWRHIISHLDVNDWDLVDRVTEASQGWCYVRFLIDTPEQFDGFIRLNVASMSVDYIRDFVRNRQYNGTCLQDVPVRINSHEGGVYHISFGDGQDVTLRDMDGDSFLSGAFPPFA